MFHVIRCLWKHKPMCLLSRLWISFLSQKIYSHFLSIVNVLSIVIFIFFVVVVYQWNCGFELPLHLQLNPFWEDQKDNIGEKGQTGQKHALCREHWSLLYKKTTLMILYPEWTSVGIYYIKTDCWLSQSLFHTNCTHRLCTCSTKTLTSHIGWATCLWTLRVCFISHIFCIFCMNDPSYCNKVFPKQRKNKPYYFSCLPDRDKAKVFQSKPRWHCF